MLLFKIGRMITTGCVYAPVCLTTKVVSHMKVCNPVGTLIVPLWKSAHFWPAICSDGLHCLSNARTRIPFRVRSPGIFSSSSAHWFYYSPQAKFRLSFRCIFCFIVLVLWVLWARGPCDLPLRGLIFYINPPWGVRRMRLCSFSAAFMSALSGL